jgi:hypothetical protein
VSQLKRSEFESIEPQALQRLELEVVACTCPSSKFVVISSQKLL